VTTQRLLPWTSLSNRSMLRAKPRPPLLLSMTASLTSSASSMAPIARLGQLHGVVGHHDVQDVDVHLVLQVINATEEVGTLIRRMGVVPMPLSYAAGLLKT
jgi:hypothetical protein